MLFDNNVKMGKEDAMKTSCKKEMCDIPCERVCPPVYECPEERVCHREILHEIPQD